MSYIVLVDDMRAALAAMEPDSVDSIVTDPPYEYGFMGKSWDSTGVAFDPATWAACLRVLKPGGHLLSFGATRTVHRIACAIEDAGFEIRDQIAWMFGSGFPKSLDVSKAIDREAGATTPEAAQWSGWGTALKPAMEPVIVARKPLVGTVAANVQRHGTGAINVDGCRIGSDSITTKRPAATGAAKVYGAYGGGADTEHLGRWPANVILDAEAGAMLDAQSGITSSSDAVRNNGAFKSVAKGFETARESFGHADSGGASRFFYCAKADGAERDAGLDDLPIVRGADLVDRDEGSAGLTPRAGAGRSSDGRRNIHPTVKPIDLMRYLCRLVTPKGGTVLDPFCGSGTTLVAGILEGFNVIGVDMETPHALISLRRCEHWAGLHLTPGMTAREAAEKPTTGTQTLNLFGEP